MKKNIKFLILLFILIFCLTGCKTKNSNEDINNKVIQELDYLDTQIASVLMKLNNMTFRNYTISSEEIQTGKESSKDNSSGEEKNEETSSKDEQKESNSQANENSESQKTNVTVTEMKSQGILQLDENEIDWEMIKRETETINEAWGVIVLDLTSINIDNNDILNFSENLNNLILSVKDENKIESLKNAANLYSFIPKAEIQIEQNDGTKNLKQAKSYLINAYSLAEEEDWEQIQTNIKQAEEVYKNVINDMEYIKNKEYKINKIYVLIKELQNSLIYKDKKLFYVKYKNLMECVDTL